MKNLVVALALVFVALPSFATAPKQFCNVFKDLRVVAAGKAARADYVAEVEFLFAKNVEFARNEPTETVKLNNEVSLQSAKVVVAKGSIAKDVNSVLYERRLTGVATRFFSVKNGARTLLFEEVDQTKSYTLGQEKPVGPVVCFEFAD